jgi:cytidine deaminase
VTGDEAGHGTGSGRPRAIIPVTPPLSMSGDDVALLRHAEELLARVWAAGRHEVATALRAVDRTVHTGVHIEGSCRRSSICAEGVALGAARAAGVALEEVASVVSVQIKPAGSFRIIAPCGVCRELLSDYSPRATVWLTRTATDEVIAVPAIGLLPEKTRRSW